MTPAALSDLPIIQRAALHLYQLYDVSYSIDLERARTTLATPIARVRPVVSRGASIDIPELPLEISMGSVTVTLDGHKLHCRIHARIYDLGIIALRLMIPLDGPLDWSTATEAVSQVAGYPMPLRDVFAQSLNTLNKTLAPAIERPNETVREEDYILLLVEHLGESSVPAASLARHPVLLQTALGERRRLSAAAASLATTLSYYEDDLIVLTWSAAIVIEPDAAAREDAALLLEFANVQLLALRSYDAEIERDLSRLAPRIARTDRPPWDVLRSSGRFQREIQGLIAEIIDTSARVENALKVTEDVYWNRVYSEALTVLRVEVWRRGIAEALTVLRQTADLLHDETQAAWTNLLEVLVVVLIAVELVVAVLGLLHY